MGTGIMNYDWFQIQGGDGFVAIPDKRDARWIYSESQDGNMIRRNKVTGESKSIRPNAQNVTPAPKPGETFRWEWDTPMIISPNDPGTLIVAANRVFVSHDRGDSWTVISPDLDDEREPRHDRHHGTEGLATSASRATTAFRSGRRSSRSPSRRSRRACTTRGATTGCVYVSRDGGKSWQNITKNLPGFPAGALDQRGRAVGVRRGHGLRDGRQPSAQRLRAVHVGEQRLRRDVPLDRRTT